MNNKSSISNFDTLTHIVCTFLFVLFAFFYLYYYQAGLLTVMQHVFSGGQTHYDRFIGAVLITLVLLLMQILVARICKKTSMPWFAVFLPSALCLAALTDVCVSPGGGMHFGMFGLCLPVALLVYAVLVYAGHSSGFFVACSKLAMSPVRKLWGNVLGLLLAMLFVCFTGNDNRVYHDRIYAEQCIMDGDFKQALQTIHLRGTADKNTTMLVAYALSRSGQLGERLFEFPLARTSDALMPNGGDVRFELLPDSSFYAYMGGWYVQRMPAKKYLNYQLRHCRINRHAADYLLCAYLMDRDLDSFAKAIGRYYTVSDSTSLPKHYREALLLYGHLRSNPVVVYTNSIMEADYQDFRKLEKSVADPRERRTAMRDTYGNTYWYYYEY